MINKKGQAAMEFLMTYGWAILVVLAAIGALAYFGVLSPSSMLPQRTTFAAPIQNTDNALVTNGIANAGTIKIPFRNNLGTQVTIDSISKADGKCGGVSTTANPTIAIDGGSAVDLTTGSVAARTVSNGEPFVMTIYCTDALVADSRFDSGISFKYTNIDSTIQRTHVGNVQSTVE